MIRVFLPCSISPPPAIVAVDVRVLLLCVMFSPPSIVLVADDIKLALEMIFRGYNKIVSTYNLEFFSPSPSKNSSILAIAPRIRGPTALFFSDATAIASEAADPIEEVMQQLWHH